MRAFSKPSQKPKNQKSKFFEYFLNQYGETCTSRASDAEIQDKMRSFFIDLIFGNINSVKYFNYLAGDVRIIVYAIETAKTKLFDSLCYRDCINKVAMDNSLEAINIKSNPNFDSCLREAIEKANVYQFIYDALVNFDRSGLIQEDGFSMVHPERRQPEYLLALAAKFRGNPFTRLTKRMIF